MNLKLGAKSGLLVLVGVVLCLTLLNYLYYTGVVSHQPSPLGRGPLVVQPYPQSDNQTFVYSTNKIYKTILGIKESLCFDFKKLKGARQKRFACAKARKCNAIKHGREDVPIGCQHRLPGCIMIGVYKAGTRELLDFMAMHPGIVIKRNPYYEISFFDKSRYSKGLQWYQQEMPYSMADQITIEKSPGYFLHPLAPKRIHQMDPNIKLILIVRDPVKRTISHFTFSNRSVTAEDIKKSFQKSSASNEYPKLVKLSIYDEQFERFLRYFKRSQIHIVDSDRFKNDPYSVLYGIETFLGLPHVIKKSGFVFNAQKGFYCLKDVSGGNSACFGDERGRKNLTDDMESVKPLLRDLFKPHNRRFSELTGQTFRWT